MLDGDDEALVVEPGVGDRLSVAGGELCDVFGEEDGAGGVLGVDCEEGTLAEVQGRVGLLAYVRGEEPEVEVCVAGLED